MKALPSTLGIPTDVDAFVEVLSSAKGRQFLGRTVETVSALYSQLAWVRTAPVPSEEAVVLDSLLEACDATLELMDSVPDWLSMLNEADGQ